jgi:antirestriction protein ArdC
MAEGSGESSFVGASSAELGTHRSSPSPALPESTHASSQTRARDLYTEITQRVIDMLDQGVVPWRSPIMGRGSAGHPRNLSSGKKYRGINVFLLAFTSYVMNYSSSYWLTYRQAHERGGHVKKGEKSTPVVFWKRYETKDKALDNNGQPIKRQAWVLRHYNLFNGQQCDSIEVPDEAKYTPIDFKPIERAEQIVRGYPNPPKIIHGGTEAFYRPKVDEVHLPDPSRFTSAEEYYGTAFHELAHSTGHSTRLDRKLDTDPQPFGSPDYGKEELVAEMAAAFLSAEAQIAPVTIANTASYISGWLGRLRSDKRLLVTAAGAAQRAAEWIQAIEPGGAEAEGGEASHE